MEPVSCKNAEHYLWSDICHGWHLLKSSGLSVIQKMVPPGGAKVAHYHEHAHQFFFIPAGTATLEIAGHRMELVSQQGISVPAKTHHRLLNEADTELIFLLISAPPSHGDRVLAV